MSAVAKPMIWLYLRTAAPVAMGDVATLCPAGICAALLTPSPGVAVPGRMSARATTTLSAWLRRMASVGMAGNSRRKGRGGRDSTFAGGGRQLGREPPSDEGAAAA